MNFHVISGTPRSGSTLLCNILNQNPRFHASSTSCVAQSLRSLSSLWSQAPEVKSDLIYNEAGTAERLARASRALVEAWYADKDEPVIFDKGRFWNHQPLVLNHLFPKAQMFVCIRDPRDIVASIEKQHTRNPVLDHAGNPSELMLRTRVEKHCMPDGLVGRQIDGIVDLRSRNLPYVHFIPFENFVRRPDAVLDFIYSTIGEERFDHDLENVENTATDADGLYLGKFPHQGSGAVREPEGTWANHIPANVARLVMGRFRDFNQAFGYNAAL